MALITLMEILYFIILTVVIGYIFSGFVNVRPRTVYDMMHRKRFDWENFKFACLVAAPAVILHELAHKFTAMGFGYDASFYIFPLGLAIGVILKLVSSPFIIIAPGYVLIPLITDQVAYRLIAFAGPLTNLVLFFVAGILLKSAKKLSRKQAAFLFLTKQINLILFIFNMIPFGPLDGAKVLFGPPS